MQASCQEAGGFYLSFMHNPLDLPAGLPVPQDDGGCDHLYGTPVPDLWLASTAGNSVSLVQLRGRTVVYCYPRTGQPDQPVPEGWDAIPGARGCTPQCRSFRDHYRELIEAGAFCPFRFICHITARHTSA